MSGPRGESETAHGVDFIPVADPLARDPDLRFVATLPVLGIATRFATNSRTVLGIVERAFVAWGALGQRYAQLFHGRVGRVEQAEMDGCRVFGKEREIDARAVVRRAKRIRRTRPQLHRGLHCTDTARSHGGDGGRADTENTCSLGKTQRHP